MNPTLLLVVLVVFSFAISRLLSRYASRFAVSGIEYIFLGIILGPQLRPVILSAEALEGFAPLINLLLGLVGFVLGLRARSSLRPANVALGGGIASMALIAMVGAAAFGVLEMLIGAAPGAERFEFYTVLVGENFLVLSGSVDNVWLALAIGCAAAVSSPALIGRVALLHRARGPVLDLLLGYAKVSQLCAIAIFGGTLVWARAAESANHAHLPITIWVAVTAGVGILIGLLFNIFIGRERDELRIYLAALGTVTFASGTGSALGVSPLVINLTAGFVVSFTSRHATRLETTLMPIRHPILVMLRIFAGALWAPVSGLSWLLAPTYVGVRVVVRWFTSWSSTWMVPKLPVVPRLGVGLVGQGGLAVAIGLSFAQRFPEQAPIALTTILGGIVLSDLWSYGAVRRILADAGETDAVAPSEDLSTKSRGVS